MESPHSFAKLGFVRCFIAVLLAAVLLGGGPLAAQAPSLDQAQRAALVLNSARTAFNQQQYDAAAARFDEYLRDFGGSPDAVSARFGRALCMLEGPVQGDVQQFYRQAIEQLNQPAGDKNFADRPLALYYQGLAWRRLGHDCLRLAAERPNEAQQRTSEANSHFAQAAPKFALALAEFEARAAAAETDPEAKELPAELQWAARARCDQAEMLLRLAKHKEALELTAPFADDAAAAESRYRPLGLYLHGYAAYSLRDHVTAGRTLSRLAPFSQPAFGNHARYLLARAHHLEQERGEAVKLYRVVQTAYEQDKAAAQQMLADGQSFKSDPAGKAAAETLVKFPPDFVPRAALYLSVLLYEQEQFSHALARLETFDQAFPNSSLSPKARLRRGMCQVQLKQAKEAIPVLEPLAQHPELGDRALVWLGRARIAAADPQQPQQVQQAVAAAAGSFRQAADRAAQRISADPEAKLRRVECQLELGDAQLRLGQFAEAVGTYETIVNEKHDPVRLEEVQPALATAYHLAKRYDDSDSVCRSFQSAFPQSALLPAVLFRYAENAYVRAAGSDVGKPLDQSPQRKQWLGEAHKRLQPLVDEYPDFEQISTARFRLGLTLAALGEYEAAAAALAAIPDADRNGELAAASYHQADAVLHNVPADAGDDALAVARLIDKISEATRLLEGYVSAAGQQKLPELPDALAKLGYCYQRTASVVVQPELRSDALNKARQAYQRVTSEFASSPVVPTAVYERAKVLVAQGDVNSAAGELGRFRSDPLRNASIAPLALLRLSALLRAQNKPADAVTVLAECRSRHEGAMRGDAARAAWVPLVWYHHGLATMETGKLAEARELFQAIGRDFAASPQAPDAAWRAGQCAKLEALARLEPARALRAKPGASEQEISQAQGEIQQAVASLRSTADYFRTQAAAVAQKAAGSPPHQQMLYEAAWCNRTVGEEEIEALRRKLAGEARTRRQQELASRYQAVNLPVPNAGLPEIALSAIDVQPGEKAAREHYEALIDAGDDSPFALRARLELAELLTPRGEYEEAVSLLLDGLDLEPPLELEQAMRVVLGDCLLAQGEAEAGREQLLAVVADEKSPLGPQARYRAGECSLALEDWPAAIELLKPFRDHGPLHNLVGLSDRAVLRLGHAYAAAGNWDQSRGAMETLLGRYQQSPWRHEARYGVGWSLQNQNNWDGAYSQYQQVTRETATEAAARAQLQMGRCRYAQGRFDQAVKDLLAVATTYDYPQWNAAALYEASRAYDELKQPEEAARQLKRLLEEYPNDPLAEPARERLAALAAPSAAGGEG